MWSIISIYLLNYLFSPTFWRLSSRLSAPSKFPRILNLTKKYQLIHVVGIRSLTAVSVSFHHVIYVYVFWVCHALSLLLTAKYRLGRSLFLLQNRFLHTVLSLRSSNIEQKITFVKVLCMLEESICASQEFYRCDRQTQTHPTRESV